MANFLPSINLMCKQKLGWTMQSASELVCSARSLARSLASTHLYYLRLQLIATQWWWWWRWSSTVSLFSINSEMIWLIVMLPPHYTIVVAVACSLHFLLIALLSIFSSSQFAVQFSYKSLQQFMPSSYLCGANHLVKLFAEQIRPPPLVPPSSGARGLWRLFIAPDNLKVE